MNRKTGQLPVERRPTFLFDLLSRVFFSSCFAALLMGLWFALNYAVNHFNPTFLAFVGVTLVLTVFTYREW